MKPGDLVEVSWDDHALHLGEYDGKTIAKQVSVGYLVKSEESVVAVAQSLTDGKPNDVLIVDRRMLTRLRLVRKK